MFGVRGIALIVTIIVLISVLSSPAECTYRKPPFNGSIFGKRTPGNSVGK